MKDKLQLKTQETICHSKAILILMYKFNYTLSHYLLKPD